MGAQGAAQGHRGRDCALAARWRSTPQHCVRGRFVLESDRCEPPLHPPPEVLCNVVWIKTTPKGIRGEVHEGWRILDLEGGLGIQAGGNFFIVVERCFTGAGQRPEDPETDSAGPEN